MILADVAREGANWVIDCLRGLDVDKSGSIAVETIDIDISESGARCPTSSARRRGRRGRLGGGRQPHAGRRHALGDVPPLPHHRHDDRGSGVLLDNPILIVGSMVVGPEFGPGGAVSGTGPGAGDGSPGVRQLGLLIGFPVAILITVGVSLRLLDLWG